jgi:hypothetical protein
VCRENYRQSALISGRELLKAVMIYNNMTTYELHELVPVAIYKYSDVKTGMKF